MGCWAISLISSFVLTEVIALRRPGDVEFQKSASDELVGAEAEDAIALDNVRETAIIFCSPPGSLLLT